MSHRVQVCVLGAVGARCLPVSLNFYAARRTFLLLTRLVFNFFLLSGLALSMLDPNFLTMDSLRTVFLDANVFVEAFVETVRGGGGDAGGFFVTFPSDALCFLR